MIKLPSMKVNRHRAKAELQRVAYVRLPNSVFEDLGRAAKELHEEQEIKTTITRSDVIRVAVIDWLSRRPKKET